MLIICVVLLIGAARYCDGVSYSCAEIEAYRMFANYTCCSSLPPAYCFLKPFSERAVLLGNRTGHNDECRCLYSEDRVRIKKCPLNEVATNCERFDYVSQHAYLNESDYNLAIAFAPLTNPLRGVHVNYAENLRCTSLAQTRKSFSHVVNCWVDDCGDRNFIEKRYPDAVGCASARWLSSRLKFCEPYKAGYHVVLQKEAFSMEKGPEDGCLLPPICSYFSETPNPQNPFTVSFTNSEYFPSAPRKTPNATTATLDDDEAHCEMMCPLQFNEGFASFPIGVKNSSGVNFSLFKGFQTSAAYDPYALLPHFNRVESQCHQIPACSNPHSTMLLFRDAVKKRMFIKEISLLGDTDDRDMARINIPQLCLPWCDEEDSMINSAFSYLRKNGPCKEMPFCVMHRIPPAYLFFGNDPPTCLKRQICKTAEDSIMYNCVDYAIYDEWQFAKSSIGTFIVVVIGIHWSWLLLAPLILMIGYFVVHFEVDTAECRHKLRHPSSTKMAKTAKDVGSDSSPEDSDDDNADDEEANIDYKIGTRNAPWKERLVEKTFREFFPEEPVPAMPSSPILIPRQRQGSTPTGNPLRRFSSQTKMTSSIRATLQKTTSAVSLSLFSAKPTETERQNKTHILHWLNPKK